MKNGSHTIRMKPSCLRFAAYLSLVRSLLERWPAADGRISILLVCIAALAASGERVAAQTPEIQEEITGFLQPEPPLGMDYLKWAWRWAEILDTEVDTTPCREPRTLSETVTVLADQLSAMGIDLRIHVDQRNLETDSQQPDCLIWRVDLSATPQRVKLGQFLIGLLDQLPCKNGAVRLGRGWLEITTTRVAAGQDRSFHLLRRGACAARYWLLLASICTAIYVLPMTAALWRRNERRLVGTASLVGGAAAVFLFWPIWLAASGFRLVREKLS